LCVFGVSLLVIISGTVLIFSSSILLKFVIRRMLVLEPGTHVYNLWKHFPELVPMDIYLFNWTNPEEIHNKRVKPRFEQVGPYRFMMDMGKSNITWNDNGTVTFRQLKYWYYTREGSKGDLQDMVTTLHPTALVSLKFRKLLNIISWKKSIFGCSKGTLAILFIFQNE
jgi:scavenger receptor class B protein 1